MQHRESTMRLVPRRLSSRRWVHLMFAVALLAGAAKELAARPRQSRDTTWMTRKPRYQAYRREDTWRSSSRCNILSSSGGRDNRGWPLFLCPGRSIAATSVCSCTTFFYDVRPGAIDVKRLVQITDRSARRGMIDPP